MQALTFYMELLGQTRKVTAELLQRFEEYIPPFRLRVAVMGMIEQQNTTELKLKLSPLIKNLKPIKAEEISQRQ